MYKQKIYSVVSILLCICILFSYIPVHVFAAEHIDEGSDVVETYTFDEHGHQICNECGGHANEHLESCSLYEEIECTCGLEIHSESCPLYEESFDDIYSVEDDTDIICLCGTIDGVHDNECPLYEVPIIDECTCGLEVHTEDCPLYEDVIIDETTCTCGSNDGVHTIDCVLYTEDINKCTCGNKEHTVDCPLYNSCTCGSDTQEHSVDCDLYKGSQITFDFLMEIENLDELYDVLYNQYEIIETFEDFEKETLLTHIRNIYNSIFEPSEDDIYRYNYLQNIINSYIIVICEDCGQENGLHLDDCDYYVCDECGGREHTENCSKYVKTEVRCEECNEKDGVHLETCSKYIEICEECSGINGVHLETCSQYIVVCKECGEENNLHLESCSLYICEECNSHKHLEECSKYVFICEECSYENHKHKEDCSFYICDECGAHEHLESCSLFKKENVCTCGSEDDIHQEDCALYIECTCKTETDKHDIDCPLHQEPICKCEGEEHDEDCALYKTSLFMARGIGLSVEEILSLNYELVAWKSQGEVGSISIIIGEEEYVVSDDNYDEIYNMVYDLLLEVATPWEDITTATNITDIVVMKLNGDNNTLGAHVIIKNGGTLVLINEAEMSSTLTFTSAGKISVKNGDLSIFGRSEDSKVIIDGNGSFTMNKSKYSVSSKTGVRNSKYNDKTEANKDKSNENLIIVRDGNLYLEYITIQNVLSNNSATSTVGGALHISTAPYTGTTKEGIVKLYASDVWFYKCLGKGAGAVGNATAGDDTEIYFYKTTFEQCVSTGASNNSGGGAIRAGAGTAMWYFEDCLFLNNLAQEGTKEGSGYNGGGAVRWNLGDNYEPNGIFTNCKFIGNAADGRGGAIVCFGGITLTSCELTENFSSVSGGAIFVASSTQVSTGSVDNKNGSMVLGNGTIVHNNWVAYDSSAHGEAGGKGYGGGIHFFIASSKVGSSGTREEYDLELFLRGAEVYDNQAIYGGAIAMSVNYNYKCGVYIEPGTEIYDNTSILYNSAGGNGGAIYIDSTSTYAKNHGVNMSGGIVRNNIAEGSGGAVYLSYGSMNMDGGSVYGNNANVNGGAIYVSDGNFEITGGSLGEIGKPNHAILGGGAYIVGGDFVLNGQNATIAGNSATDGAGIYLTGGSPLLFSGIMEGNFATNNGGGIYIDQQNVVLNPTGMVQINANKATNGAGIYIGGTEDNLASFSIDKTSSGEIIIDENIADGYGAAVCIDNGLFNLNSNNISISNNEAYSGGAVAVLSGDFLMSEGRIDNCTATQNGGAVYVMGNFDISGGTISNCSAKNGGGTYIDQGSFVMSGGQFYNNSAEDGGAVYVSGGNFELDGGSFYLNDANFGGAAYISGGNIDVYDGLLDTNSATDSGGAIYATSDSKDILINIYSGRIINNTAGNHAGAIGASVSGDLNVTINVGLEECSGINTHVHGEKNCPEILNNTADIYGGAFCLHGNSDALFVNIYCGTVTGNIALRYPGSNTINQEGGRFTIYGGNIDPGVMVGGGIFEDNRLESVEVKVRFWGNYNGAPTDPVIIEVTNGITLNFPTATYTWAEHELSGWTNIPNSQDGWVPVGGQYAVNDDGDGYLDYYAVWDASISYIVYIPEFCDIGDNGIGTLEISADISYFKKDSNLETFIITDFLLINVNNSSDILTYQILTTEPGVHEALSSGDLAASWQYNNTADKILTLEVLNSGLTSGSYSGTITFNIVYSEE